VRQEKATATPVASAAPAPDAAPAPVATAVLDRAEPISPTVAAVEAFFDAPKPIEPATSPARPSGTWRRVAVIAVAVIAAVAATSVVGSRLGSPSDRAEKRVADYVAGKGTHEFIASDSNFRASFPFGQPKRDTQSRSVGPLTVEFVNYSTETDAGAFAVGSFVLPAGVAYDLNGGVNGAAVATAAHIESATPTTFQGFRAIEFVLTGTDSGKDYVDKGLIVDSGARVYFLQTLWQDGPAPGYDTFKASFHIG
jgi:hypothetical protein